MKIKSRIFLSLILVCAMILCPAFSTYAEPVEIQRSVNEPTEPARSNLVDNDVYDEGIMTSEGEQRGVATASTINYVKSSNTVVPNGIYSFQNSGNGMRWLDIQYDSTEPGYHVQQYEYDESPADGNSNAALYRVTQVGNTGRYVIRLMLNENLSFGFSGSEILTKTIPANDADVSIYDTFYIERIGQCFTIRPYGSTMCVSAKDTMASGAVGAPDSYLTPRTVEEAGERAKWIVEGHRTYIYDGVYALENIAVDNCWMDIEGDISDPGYHVQQYDYGNVPTVNFDRGGLFKISQIGNTGRYVIRLMLDNRLSFEFNNGEITTKIIPDKDSEVSIEDTFLIVFNNGGYAIKAYGQNEAIASNSNTAFGIDEAPDSYLIPRFIRHAGYAAKWDLYRYTGVDKWGVNWSGVGSYVAGRSITITVKTWSTVINCNAGYVFEQGDNVSSDWDYHTKTAIIYFHDEGPFLIRVAIVNENGGGVAFFDFERTVKLPMDEGVYYMQNKELENFMQTDNDDSPDYDTENAIIELHDFNAGHHQKWVLTHIHDGYYRIHPYHIDYTLAVQEAYVNSSGQPLVQQEYFGVSRHLWKLTAYTDGSFVIRPKSGESYATDWCLSAGSGVGSSGRNVEQCAYTNNSDYKDRWFFYKCVGADDVFLLGIEEPDGRDRSSALINITPMLFSMGYNEVSFIMEDSFPLSTYLSYLQQSKVHVVRCHGGISGAYTRINIASPSSPIYVNSYDIYNFSTETPMISLENCDLILFVACKTAATEKCLPQAAINAGATYAIGFKDTIYCDTANSWTEAFFRSYTAGNTVQDACEDATDSLFGNWNMDEYKIYTQ